MIFKKYFVDVELMKPHVSLISFKMTKHLSYYNVSLVNINPENFRLNFFSLIKTHPQYQSIEFLY